MTQKLNQIIAIEKGLKERTLREVTDLYHQGQKSDPFNGFSRAYQPRVEGGEQFPPETKLVQSNAVDVVTATLGKLVELFDVTASKDWANLRAGGDVVVDGETLLTGAPVTYLLFLEQHLAYVKTVFEKLPTLSPDDKWTVDPNTRLYNTAAVQSIKTAKVQEALVLIQPTKEHPGRAEIITKDVSVGTWEITKMSGAMPVPIKARLLERVEKLIRAVKFAREAANMIDAPKQEVGAKILNWLSRGVVEAA